mgnify:CR=1
MKNKLMIIGAGGHSKVALDIALLMKRWDQISFLDDLKSGDVLGYNIVGKISDMDQYKETYDFFVAIGNNEARESIYNQMSDIGLSIATIIHPKAVISKFSDVGQGSIIMAGSIINPNVNIGKGCIINTNSSVDHDCVIGDFVHISPGVAIGGTTTIGKSTWLGIGCSVINNINIASNAIIGAGSCVINDVTNSGVYIGIPARRTDSRVQ